MMVADRYAALEAHADAGLGAEELGTRRFTRICERLDLAADRAWARFEDSPRDHPNRDMLRDLAFAAKDRADEFARSGQKKPPTSRQAIGGNRIITNGIDQ
ncbi:hypothetical protein GTV32_14600 [Gordonia sp. SID5947]|uniref:hypothetical protein n=1 Tax=Gordonia sp. SID5947 TaxID=2690315 RepID=UPI001369E003|nr:hypothetical protein [Gordonia sp. SID5947]MYR07458.1 hypothetical protein [Gordonia sp. SID5947]